MKNKLQCLVNFMIAFFFLLSGNLLPMAATASAGGFSQQDAAWVAMFPCLTGGAFPDHSKPYVFLKELAKGVCGKVFLCRQHANGQLVVGKVVPMKTDREAKYAERELTNQRQCNHFATPTLICHCDSIDSIDGKHRLLMMEYADAGTLRDQIKMKAAGGAKFTEQEIMFFFIQLFLAVDYIHGKHVLHRDIKSENIFITKQNIVKLGDFGYSSVFEGGAQRPRKATPCGTPYYMAPELVECRDYNNKIDMWALGVMLFEMATLMRPYYGGNFRELYAAIRKGQYKSSLLEGYSEDLKRLVAWLLNFSPDRRPDTKQLFCDPYIQHWLREFEQWAAQSTSLSEEQKKLIRENIFDAKPLERHSHGE